MDEAEGYLTICPQTDAEQRKVCDYNQHTFIRNYVAAKAGQHLGQLNVAFDLSLDLANQQAGVLPNQVQGCAWAMVADLDGSPEVSDIDRDSIRNWCDPLDPLTHQAAEARARSLLAEIAASPATLPPDQPAH